MSVTSLEHLRLNSEIDAGYASLAQNEYPGRVLIMGMNKTGDLALQAYGITGRSEPSRTREAVLDDGAVRITAPGMTPEEMAKVKNADLIYYKAMMSQDGVNVVSNGAQTEPVLKSVLLGNNLDTAVRTAPVDGEIDLSKYEPDDPNFTPRITGVIDLRSDAPTTFGLTVVRKSPDSDEPIYDSYDVPHADQMFQTGLGLGIQTYNGNNEDGPLPSFDQEPFAYPLGEGTLDTALTLWDTLPEGKRTVVAVRAFDIETLKIVDTVLIDNFANQRS